jgi:uncharacterized caspase-like protein
MTRRTFAYLAGSWPFKVAGLQDRTVKPGRDSVEQPPRTTARLGRRTALVIGNNSYVKARPLNNAVHDATDMSEALKRVQFDVTAVLDADLISVRKALREFCSRMHDGDVALFFYAGHGVQLDAENYLVPVDFDPARGEAGMKAGCLAASEAGGAIQRSAAATGIFVLDACRNNPFHTGVAPPSGLALMDVGLGSYIALSTAPGRTASDNPSERNGLFTKYLLREITRPGQSIEQTLSNVKRQVFEESNQKQRPWLHSDLIAEFFFVGLDIQMRPSSSTALIENGRRRFEAKQYEAAKQAFEQAVRIDPENAFIYNALGATYAQMRQWSIATGLFAKAIEIKPNYAAAYFNRGIAYHDAGRHELALQDFSWAIDEEPFDPLALDLRGKAYFLLRDYENAKADFDRALQLNPTDWAALLGRGRVSFRRAQLPEAVSDLNSSILIHRSAEAFEVRSQVYRAMNRLSQSEADHQSAIRLQQK